MSINFLMCSERSGSNFISKFLNGHSNICGPSTKHIINPVARNLFRYGDLTDKENWNALLIDIHQLMSVDFSVWKKNFQLEDLNLLAVAGDIKSLIQNIFMEEARANGKQHVFIKENQVYEFLPFLLIHFPDSKFVFQTRDPRDMALSWKKNKDHFGGVVRAARQWRQDQQQSLKNYHLLKELGKAHFVKYEELTANSELEIRKILDFLGIPFDPSVFDFHKDEITQRNSSMQSAWENLGKGVITNNSRKYLDELSVEEIIAIEKICFFEMNHLGYESSHSLEELNIITEAELDDLDCREIQTLQYILSPGVEGNIRAKKTFYNR